MAAIAIRDNAKAAWLTGIAGVRAKAREMVRRALDCAAATVLACAVGAALFQLVAELVSFPAPIAVTAITVIAAALLNSLRRHIRTQPGTGTARGTHIASSDKSAGSDRVPARAARLRRLQPGSGFLKPRSPRVRRPKPRMPRPDTPDRREMRKSDQGSVRLAPVWDPTVSHCRLACFAQRRRAIWACLGEMCRCCILPAGVAVYNCGVRGHDGIVWAFSGDDQFRWCCRGRGPDDLGGSHD